MVSTVKVDLTSVPDPRMERLHSNLASQSVHQSAAWPILNRPNSKQRDLFFTAVQDEVMISAGLIRLRSIFKGRGVAAIQRGPIVEKIDQLGDVVTAIGAKLKGMGVATLSVNPVWMGEQAAAAQSVLERAGFARVPADLQNFPTVTAVIDTTQDTEALMSAYSQSGRRHLRKAIKAGVTCRLMRNSQEAELANEIMAGMALETGLILDSQHDFRPHFDYLQANPHQGNVLVTELEGRIFGAAVNYIEGRRGYNMLLTTSSDVRVPRSYVLMWESILASKAQGATSFDMVGFPDAEVETDDGMEKRGAFKRSFGPNIVKVAPIMSKPLNPALHYIFNGLRIIKRKRQKAAVS